MKNIIITIALILLSNLAFSQTSETKIVYEMRDKVLVEKTITETVIDAEKLLKILNADLKNIEAERARCLDDIDKRKQEIEDRIAELEKILKQ